MSEEIEKLQLPKVPRLEDLKDIEPRWFTMVHDGGYEEKVPLNWKAALLDVKELEDNTITGVNEEFLGPARPDRLEV